MRKLLPEVDLGVGVKEREESREGNSREAEEEKSVTASVTFNIWFYSVPTFMYSVLFDTFTAMCVLSSAKPNTKSLLFCMHNSWHWTIRQTYFTPRDCCHFSHFHFNKINIANLHQNR